MPLGGTEELLLTRRKLVQVLIDAVHGTVFAE